MSGQQEIRRSENKQTGGRLEKRGKTNEKMDFDAYVRTSCSRNYSIRKQCQCRDFGERFGAGASEEEIQSWIESLQ